MNRNINKLNTREINKKLPGRYADGGGLYLWVKPSGARYWLFRFMLRGRARAMGLGSTTTLSLVEARSKALDCRRQLLDKTDPIEARKARWAAQASQAVQYTFRTCALAYIKSNRAGWRNEKHADQWKSTLTTYAFPKLGELSVDAIDTSKVLDVIEPIWATKSETASRVRQRIEAVLSWATVRGYRSGDNPARWRGHLDSILPKRSKVAAVRHHPALPYDEAPAFMKDLRAQDGMAARALEFIILTAARTGEVIGGRWPEVDFDKRVWNIPAERMKAARPHKVPLPRAAMRLLEGMRETANGDYVFPGARKDMALSNMACLALLERMGREDLTVHGFRSTFRDWAAERTDFPSEVVEAALAHVIANKVEAAYRRGDLFDKRRELMQAWASYCGQKPRSGAISKSNAARAPHGARATETVGIEKVQATALTDDRVLIEQ